MTINSETGKKYVLLTCGEGVQLSSEAITFHIVVHATAAAVTDFTVTIKDDRGYTMKKSLSTSSKLRCVGSAAITYTYWTHWGGLIRATVDATLRDGNMTLREEKQVTLVKYNCNIHF